MRNTEFLNGGVGFYSFQNYLGLIKKFSQLKPDLYVVTVYIGNDFIEGLLYEKENQSIYPSLQTFWYRLKKGFFQMTTKMASTQCTNQILFFKTFPEKKQKALDLARKYLTEIKTLCGANGTKLLVVLLPSKLESEKEFKEKIKQETGWDERYMNINQGLATELQKTLVAEKIDCMNVTDEFQKSGQKLFWDIDQHMNRQGHAVLAKIVLEKCQWKAN
jgi:hypothetical protein